MSQESIEHFRAIVCEVQLEQLANGAAYEITGLAGYHQAFVVFRSGGTVVGQGWLPIDQDRVRTATLRAHLVHMAWAVWQQTMKPPAAVLPPPAPASVVVCTRNRTSDLARCLVTLAKLTEQGHEVIIVDSCPSDESTKALVATYPQIRYVWEPRPGAGIARNRGLLEATHPIMAFTDDDAMIDEGWLPALLRNFDDPMVAVVTGITMPLELETQAQQWFERTNGFARGFQRREFDITTLSPLAAGVVGASVNVAIRRSALPEIGLFVEALGPGTPAHSGEDHEFFYRVLARGYRIVYEPAALVWHRHRRDWPALQRTIYGYGVGVFAWWTHAFFHEKEWSLLYHAPKWFFDHHVRELGRAVLQRPHHSPLDLAWAEFKGALAGPWCYWQARRLQRRQAAATPTAQLTIAALNALPQPHTTPMLVESLEALS